MSNTYEEIYNRMKQTYETERGDTVDEASDIAIRLRTLAGEIYNMQSSLEWTKRQFFAATATGESLGCALSQPRTEKYRRRPFPLLFPLRRRRRVTAAILLSASRRFPSAYPLSSAGCETQVLFAAEATGRATIICVSGFSTVLFPRRTA